MNLLLYVIIMCIRNYKYSCLKHKVSKIYSKTNVIMEVFCNFAAKLDFDAEYHNRKCLSSEFERKDLAGSNGFILSAWD